MSKEGGKIEVVDLARDAEEEKKRLEDAIGQFVESIVVENPDILKMARLIEDNDYWEQLSLFNERFSILWDTQLAGRLLLTLQEAGFLFPLFKSEPPATLPGTNLEIPNLPSRANILVSSVREITRIKLFEYLKNNKYKTK